MLSRRPTKGMDMNNLGFTKADLTLFKKAYQSALDTNEYMFIFKNHEFLVDYAKYLIEHLENKLK